MADCFEWIPALRPLRGASAGIPAADRGEVLFLRSSFTKLLLNLLPHFVDTYLGDQTLVGTQVAVMT